MTQEIEREALPPLPQPRWPSARRSEGNFCDEYIAEEMHAYALAALAMKEPAEPTDVRDVMLKYAHRVQSAQPPVDEREALRAACHHAIARALLEGGVTHDVLRGMCFEVGLEAFDAALAGCWPIGLRAPTATRSHPMNEPLTLSEALDSLLYAASQVFEDTGGDGFGFGDQQRLRAAIEDARESLAAQQRAETPPEPTERELRYEKALRYIAENGFASKDWRCARDALGGSPERAETPPEPVAFVFANGFRGRLAMPLDSKRWESLPHGTKLYATPPERAETPPEPRATFYITRLDANTSRHQLKWHGGEPHEPGEYPLYATPPERAETPQASPEPSDDYPQQWVENGVTYVGRRAQAEAAPQPSPSNRRTGQ